MTDGLPNPSRALAFLTLAIASIMAVLDGAIVNVALPIISSDMDVTPAHAIWVVNAYQLAVTVSLLPLATLGDILGYRRIFLWGTGISALAFVACALSPSYGWLLAGRVGQGIGAGLILSVGPALATSLFPEEQRARVLGHYMTMFGLGGALGPSVFGLLLEQYGWSAVWGFRAPLSAVAFLLAWTLPKAPRADRQETFDAAGAISLALALSFFLLALNRLREPLWFAVCAAVCAACETSSAHSSSRPLSRRRPLVRPRRTASMTISSTVLQPRESQCLDRNSSRPATPSAAPLPQSAPICLRGSPGCCP